ncbi:MAG TPA: hypothetical protein VMU25_01795, partial [Candidatus Paceibacterota bacterium]|nr:hypothetical protein [Candidatus Paceibacterota bacterium]
ATCRYSTTASFTFSSGTLFSTTGGTSHSTTLSPLANGTSYTYYVKCQDTSGNTSGNASVMFSVATPADTQAPTTPTGLTATAISSSQINLTWTASTDNVGVTSYTIYRNGTQIGTSATNSYSDTGLSASTQYSYTVSASDAAGNMSGQSTSASATTQAAQQTPPPTSPSSVNTQHGYDWKTLKIGGGGWLVGMDIAPDGTMVARTDTYGGYVWNGTQWQQLITTQSMPASDIKVLNADGLYELRLAPSNPNRMYMMFNGSLYRTDNKGTTWIKTAFTQGAATADISADNHRMYNHKMMVDPVNPDVVYTGNPSNLYMSGDGGNTWALVTGVPAAVSGGAGLTGMAFDPSSGQTNGKTNVLYVASWGNGVYRSTDAGVTWTKTNGGPTTVSNAVVASDGIYYATDGSAAWKYANGTWTKIESSQPWQLVAVDPTNPARVIIGDGGARLDQSLDRGATWGGVLWGSGTPQITNIATDVPWLAWTNDQYKSSGILVFDPAATNKLYLSEGIGIWWTSLATNQPWQAGVTWNSQTIGIEQLVANEIIVPPGGQPVVGSDDRPVFYISNPDVYPSKHGPNNLNTIVHGYDLDYATNNPNFVAGIFNWWGVEQSGYSTDGGQTWTSFASKPADVTSVPKIGGSLAVSTPTNMVWIPSNNDHPYYTKDGGVTWVSVIPPGTTANDSGWGFAMYLDRHIVAADKVTTGTLYAYNSNTGVFRSTDGGATWTLLHSGELTTGSNFNAWLRSVPGEAGNLFFTTGAQGSVSSPHPTNTPFMRSTDGGATWTNVPNVKEVFSFGFGKPATAGGYPTIFIAGYVNNVWGVWRSDDNAATWTQIADWPLNSIDEIKAVAGDPNIYGRVYIGFAGSGYAYGDISGGGSSTPPSDTQAPSTPASLSASAVSSSQINLSWAASTDNVGVTGYNVFRGGTLIGTSATNSYSDTNLAASTNYSYTVSAYDAAGNTSAQSSSASATTQAGSVDTTPPTVTITAPTGQLAANTSSTNLTVTTNENATCAWANTAGVAFASMTAFSTTGGTSHSTALTGLTNGSSYTTYVKCKDTSGNISTDSSTSFSVASSAGGSGGGTSATFTPIGNGTIQDLGYASRTATFSGVAIGTPSSDRIVVVGVADINRNCQTASVTIGGTAATEAVGDTSIGFGGDSTLWYASIPTGTSANITATCGVGGDAYGLLGIQVGTITGASPTPSATGVHLATINAADPQLIPGSGTITVPANSVAVIFGSTGSTGNNTVTWTNATGDEYAHTESGLTLTALMAHSYQVGSDTFSVSGSVGNGFGYGSFSGVVAVWGP